MTSIVIDAQLRRSVEHINAQFWRFWGIWPPKCFRPLCRPQKGTYLRDCA